MNFDSSIEEQFLCHAIRHRQNLDCEKLWWLYQKLGDSMAFAICSKNCVSSIAADALRCCHPSNRFPGKKWQRVYQEVRNRVDAYLRQLDRVALLLATRGVTVLALKNSGIARSIYPFSGACPMGDIDVLVRKADFQKAHTILIENGFYLKFRSPIEDNNIINAERSGGAEYVYEFNNGEKLWFELQWRPVAGRWIQPNQEPSADQLISRSLPIDGSKVRLLCPEDNLLQVALHTAKHSYVRAPGFRLHTDVDRIVQAYPELNWQHFIRLAYSLQVKTAVYFSLIFAKKMLNTPIPNDIIEKLRPLMWKEKIIFYWLRKVGLFQPNDQKFSKPAYILFTILLYDNFRALLRAIFPAVQWMKRHYRFNKKILLPYYYGRRLADLMLRRTNT